MDANYISYDVACTLLNVLPLNYRRTDLCTAFAIKLYKSPRGCEFFTPAIKMVNTRSERELLVNEPKCNTKRCYNAPHNYLARIVNKNKFKIENSKYSCIVISQECDLWTTGAVPSFPFCAKNIWHIRLLCISPHHMVLDNKHFIYMVCFKARVHFQNSDSIFWV